MALSDETFKSELQQFFEYMNGKHFEDPESVSYWNRMKAFSTRRPNRVLKGLERLMICECRMKGMDIIDSDEFLPKEKRRFKDQHELELYCGKQVHSIVQKMFQKEFQEFMDCCEAAEKVHPGETYSDFFQQQGLKGKCQKKYEADSEHMASRVLNVYEPKLPESK